MSSFFVITRNFFIPTNFSFSWKEILNDTRSLSFLWPWSFFSRPFSEFQCHRILNEIGAANIWFPSHIAQGRFTFFIYFLQEIFRVSKGIFKHHSHSDDGWPFSPLWYLNREWPSREKFRADCASSIRIRNFHCHPKVKIFPKIASRPFSRFRNTQETRDHGISKLQKNSQEAGKDNQAFPLSIQMRNQTNFPKLRSPYNQDSNHINLTIYAKFATRRYITRSKSKGMEAGNRNAWEIKVEIRLRAQNERRQKILLTTIEPCLFWKRTKKIALTFFSNRTRGDETTFVSDVRARITGGNTQYDEGWLGKARFA